jgi:hypothetical protein
MTASAREEAERLVATMIAMAASGGLGAAARASGDSSGTRDAVAAGLGAIAESVSGIVGRLAKGPEADREPGDPKPAGSPHSWATGSAECCVCPVCRAIAAVRDPSPETAARLAAGAGDLAAGVAGMMRALSSLAGDRPKPPPARPAPPEPDETWSFATRTTAPGPTGTDEADTAAPGDDPRLAGDPWAAASAASAADAEAERLRARRAADAARRTAAKAAREAAAEAARRVAEAAALAEAAKAKAAGWGSPRNAGSGTPESETGDTDAGAGRTARTPQRFDVWAAATADAGVGDVARPTTVDHDVPGAEAPGERDGAAGDAAPGDGASGG